MTTLKDKQDLAPGQGVTAPPPPQYLAPPPVLGTSSNGSSRTSLLQHHQAPPPPPPHQQAQAQVHHHQQQQLVLAGANAVDMLKFRKTEPQQQQQQQQDRRTAALLQELALLRETNRRLAEDNRELRDLACFLDDDRQKGRKLAREWQRFGRYTASVMRQEVHAYQSKLRELDDRQQELLRDNLELKELCLYLDEERTARNTCASCAALLPGRRDDGDGSSSGTNGEEGHALPAVPAAAPAHGPAPQRIDDRAVRYLRSLETKVERLEEEKRAMRRELVRLCGEGAGAPGGSRPEAVVRALQVLEMRDGLDSADGDGSAEMDDCEKALVREMCDVVWRRLEDDRPEPRR